MIRKSSYHGNPYIGLFLRANSRLCIAPTDINKKLELAVEEALDVPLVKVNIAESNLNGAYVCMSSDLAFVPDIASEREVSALRDSGVDVVVPHSKFNAWGNNLVITRKGGLINPHIEREVKKEVEDITGFELASIKISNYSTVGSVVCATEKGFVAGFKASDSEMKVLEEVFKTSGERCSTNLGNIFVSLGIIANEKGAVIGENTTGIESARIMQGLDLA